MDDLYKYGRCNRYRNDQSDNAEGYEAHPWIPSDMPENYANRKEIANVMKWTDDNVKYRINKWGFRHDSDFEYNPNSIVFVGCSITFGLGVNYDQSFPYYVSKELGLDCINLGQPGVGLQACYRVLKYWLPIIKPKAVMFYIPDPTRKELYHDEVNHVPECVGHWSKRKDKDYFELTMDKREVAIHKMAYLDAIENVCKDTKYIAIDYKEQTQYRTIRIELWNTRVWNNTDEAPWARDLIHPGPLRHRENIAPLFIERYKNES